MNESSDDQQNGRAILCQQNGELSEFAEILAELNVPIQQHAGKLPSPDDFKGASVAILHGRRLLDGHGPNLDRWPRTIAVIDGASKTLAASLSRTGVAMVIHRPIHPRALRLLLLHEIYSGPERRGKKRILIGHPIQAKTGLFKHQATLLELSKTGARIETLNTPKIGQKVRLILGKELALGKPIRLDGLVVRCIRASGTKGRLNGEIGIELSRESAKGNAKAIDAILMRFAMGPARWEGAQPQQAPRGLNTALDATETLSPEAHVAESSVAQPRVETPNPGSTQKLPPRHTPEERAAFASSAAAHFQAAPGAEFSAQSSTYDDASPQPEQQDDRDRRKGSRIPYERKIVALGEEAARVLVGQDLSQGGMRIGPNETVSVGDVLRVALHCGSELEPLVVLADVMRDDGDKGLILTFKDLSSTATDHLEKIIASSMPIKSVSVESDEGETAYGNIVIGEMLETIKSVPDAGQPIENVG